MSAQDVVVKKTQPLRVAESRGVANALDPESIGPVFMKLAPALAGHIAAVGGQPGMLVGYYEEPAQDGSIGVHVCFEIGPQAVPADDRVNIVELPLVEVAAMMHRGPIDGVAATYGELVRWIDDSGYRIAGNARELYHEMGPDGPLVTELQIPIAR